MLSHFSPLESPILRAPVALKLGLTLALILGLGALPTGHARWGLLALPVLLLVAHVGKVPLRALVSGLLLALPFLLGVAVLALFQRGLAACTALLVKSMLSVLSAQLLARTTPTSQLLLGLRRARVPEVLCTTITLLYRYSFVLSDESTRMRRARAGRTQKGGRLSQWRARGGSLGLLFVRTVARAERVHAAMRSRGGA